MGRTFLHFILRTVLVFMLLATSASIARAECLSLLHGLPCSHRGHCKHCCQKCQPQKPRRERFSRRDAEFFDSRVPIIPLIDSVPMIASPVVLSGRQFTMRAAGFEPRRSDDEEPRPATSEQKPYQSRGSASPGRQQERGSNGYSFRSLEPMVPAGSLEQRVETLEASVKGLVRNMEMMNETLKSLNTMLREHRSQPSNRAHGAD